ncbi:MAG: ParB N-terminal domain-containing protein [Nitrospira sp.]|nr:ParB N-terminal domain-containing protein [Nitrospira sp.]
MDVDEIIQSILSSGYLNYEPLIVMREGNSFKVLEGNRRLAALTLLADKGLRDKLGILLSTEPSDKALPKQIKVRLVDSRKDARAYIGFKHINGPMKWDAIAKARYAAQWFIEGSDIDTISKTLGDNHNTVRRLVNGWFALEQAKASGFVVEDISKKRFAFSHLYTALTRNGYREFLGLGDEDLSSDPKKDPIPKKKTKEFLSVMSWLYGQEKQKESALIRSQNPDLNKLNQVLLHPEAKKLLVAERNLDSAFERVEPASKRFEDALLKASRQCEDANKLSGHYEGDSILLQVADGMQKTVKVLVFGMKEKVRTGEEGE